MCFLVDSIREIPVELWLIVRFFNNFFRESSGVDVPLADFILNQFKSIAQAPFSTIVLFLLAAAADIAEDWLWIEGKGDKLVLQFHTRVIACVSNKAGFLVLTTTIWVVTECSRGEFATVFEKWEVKCKGALKLYSEAVMGDTLDSEGFRGLGHWVEEWLSNSFLTT